MSSISSLHLLVKVILEWLFLNKRRGRTVSFCWFPAHVGVSGRDKADALAKAAARRPALTQFSVPAEDFCSAVKKCARRCWQERWNAVGPNKLRNIRHGLEIWSYRGLSRRWETALVRFRIGHTKMTHGYLMQGGPSPLLW